MSPRRKPPKSPFQRWLTSGWRGRVVHFLRRDIWHVELEDARRFRAMRYRAARVVLLAFRGFRERRGSMRSAALTYATVLSIVPMLALSFSVAKGLGFYDTLKQDTIEPFLESYFGPSPPEGSEPAPPPRPDDGAGEEAARGEEPGQGDVAEEEGEAERDEQEEEAVRAALEDAKGEPPPVGTQTPETRQRAEEVQEEQALRAFEIRRAIDEILEIVEGFESGKFATVVVLFLLFTVINLLGAIERVMNDVWGVMRARSLTRKVTDYLAIVIVPTTLLTGATAATVAAATWLQTRHLGFVAALAPLVGACLGIGFLYVTIPNRSVPLLSAALGGLVAGTLWHGIQVAHIELQIGIGQLNAVYSTFAALPIFLVWTYLSWIVVLFGAEIAVAHENEPLYSAIARTRAVDQEAREALALRIAGRVTETFLGAGDPCTIRSVAERGALSPRAVAEVVERLVDRHILVPLSEGDEECYLPARDPGTITCLDVLRAVREEEESVHLPVRDALDRRVERIRDGFERLLADSLQNLTLRELARDSGEAGGEAEPELVPEPRRRETRGTTGP